MCKYLKITIQFLQPYFHGRDEMEEPEWPPSPLRLLQSLMAASAAHWNERNRITTAREALLWLETQKAPQIIAAFGSPSSVKTLFYVPDNSADLLVPKWKKGNLTEPVKRAAKVVCPTHLLGDSVHYIFPISDDFPYFSIIQEASRSITHLGWGIDMVVGNANWISREELASLKGEYWIPDPLANGVNLRIPVAGTFEALVDKHELFLARMSDDCFRPVPALTRFQSVPYRKIMSQVVPTYAAFSILQPDTSGFRAFDTIRRARDVAGLIRHTTSEVCKDWPYGDKEEFIHGHGGLGRQLKGEKANDRFQYLPLPSIERRGNLGIHVGAIRRILITAPPQFQERIDWIRRRLPGEELLWNGKAVGILNLLPRSDWVLKQYVGNSTIWSTVTPVVFPGHDDRNGKKAEAILRKAFLQAGINQHIVDQIEDLEWRSVGFRSGNDLASRYVRPEHMNGPVYHVRVRFSQPVPGPIAVGAGRYRGFGLFASEIPLS